MGLNISCSQCGKQYKVPDSVAGRKARCKACGNVMSIPALDEGLDAFAELAPMATNGLLDELQPASESMLQPLAPIKSKAVVQASRTSHMSMAKPEPSEKRLGWAITLLVIGGVLLFLGYREWQLASVANVEPQKITLADLVANGPGDNIHLELSGVRLLPELSVIETESRNSSTSRWTYVWIPAVPKNWTGIPDISQVKVIVGATRISDEEALFKFCRKTKLQGLIVNITDSIDSEAQELLNEGLSGIDSGSCHFFRYGQKPASGTTQALMLGGGILVFFLSLCIGGYELWARTG